MATYGKAFQPQSGSNGVDEQGRPKAGGPAPIQQAIRLISTRLPSVLGARALSPAALMHSAGGAGMSQGEIERLFRPQGAQGAPAMPPSPTMPGAAMPPWMVPSAGMSGPAAQPSAPNMTAGPSPSAAQSAAPPRQAPPPPSVTPGVEGFGESQPLAQIPSVPQGLDLGPLTQPLDPGGTEPYARPSAPAPAPQDSPEQLPFLEQMLGPAPGIIHTQDNPDWLRRLLEFGGPAQGFDMNRFFGG